MFYFQFNIFFFIIANYLIWCFVWEYWRRRCLFIKKIFHRRSIAVHMLEAGDSLITIKAFLGHASILTTIVYYGKQDIMVSKAKTFA